MRRLGWLALLVLVCGCSVGVQPPDLVLLNARVFTADEARPWAEAIAIRGERVIGVGATAEIAALAGPGTRRIDVGGRTVVPGLNDAFARVPRVDGGVDPMRELAVEAARYGITTLQVPASDRTMAEAVRAAQAAGNAVRWHLLRYPQPRSEEEGGTVDSRPFLPPLPGQLIDARGMAWVFPGVPGRPNPNLSHERLAQVVGWGYGSEDQIVVAAAGDADARAYVDALEVGGMLEVWRAKRPRLVAGAPLAVDLVPRAKALGLVVIYCPGRGAAPIGPLVESGVTVAIGSDGVLNPFLNLQREAAAALPANADVARARAMTAYTRGSAIAEHAEKDKGMLAVGMLADLAVLSGDPFTMEPVRLPTITSVLTLIGGTVVHDAGTLAPSGAS
ncbi:MAG: amidohydrolase family protein [Vicinamibacterales bacterium]